MMAAGRPLGLDTLEKLLAKIFPGAEVVPNIETCDNLTIYGVRWAKLKDSTCSDTIFKPRDLKEFRRNAHGLLTLMQPARSRAWLTAYLKRDAKSSLSFWSIWDMYKSGRCRIPPSLKHLAVRTKTFLAFRRFSDTHSLISMAELQQCIRSTFPKCEHIAVAEGCIVIQGVCARAIPLSAEQALAQNFRRDYKRLNRAGLLTTPVSSDNTFTRKLREKPLLGLPQYIDGRPSGSFLDRLRRRREGKPLGDEEPGFPGVSMKRVQREAKHALGMELQPSAREDGVGSALMAVTSRPAGKSGPPYAETSAGETIETETEDPVTGNVDRSDVNEAKTNVLRQVLADELQAQI